MYEYLLKWGFDTLTKAGIASGQHENSLLLEAVKAKNTLVIERFKVAEKACENIVELLIRLERELAEFQKNFKTRKGDKTIAYLGALKSDFHPQYYREFRKIRTKFDITNDLLSGYAIGLVDWVQFENISKLCKERKCAGPADVSRTYRMVWTFLASTLTRLLRISSNDLRFWLTDRPYSKTSIHWARNIEVPALREFFLRDLDGGEVYFPALESVEGLDKFWQEVS